ncbi:MAG: DUF1727 domain-containing protein, partial [Candidatus Levybacteria bacterium]|nr:DUF1727 domain-containing protein [Candidatus Levybacteria bacterium]
MNFNFPLLIGKASLFFIRALRLGSGSTWPGHIVLSINPNFVNQILKKSEIKIIVIAGTNGKTTTGKLISTILKKDNKKVIRNASGANLLNGLATSLIWGSDMSGKQKEDYLIFESDENALPQVIKQTNPDYIIALNLFRDQLDRYGEIDSIAKKWKTAFSILDSKTTLILNSDDPQMAQLASGTKAKSLFFGLDELGKDKTSHGADTTYCPRCFEKLNFETVFFSHLGIWQCPNCKLKRPKPDLSKLLSYPLSGTYNKYNALAAALFAKSENIKQQTIEAAFKNFTPAFGRQEKMNFQGKNVQIFLSKNPTSFNESLTTVEELRGKNLLILLNDRIPDGLDVSWIWDINFEEILNKDKNIAVSGDRVYDMALRLKYAEQFTHVEPNLNNAINKMIENLEK